MIGSDQRLELSVEVTNEGEDAYEAALYVAMPSNVSYVKTEMLAQSNAGLPVSEMSNILCSPPTADNGFVLKCDLGNPMLGFSMVSYFMGLIINDVTKNMANLHIPSPSYFQLCTW